jgi:hypothetical protein
MSPGFEVAYIAFDEDRCIATGDLRDVARAAKETLDRHKDASILVFDGRTSDPIDIDFRGTIDDVLARLPKIAGAPAAVDDAAQPASRGPGRPKLGVVAREVTLLPRHWEAAYRFIAAMAENKPHYDEVARALFAGDAERFEAWTASWPADVRDHARRLAAAAFERDAPHESVDPVDVGR